MKAFTFVLLLGTFVALLVACNQSKGDKMVHHAEAIQAFRAGINYSVDVYSSQIFWEGSKPTGNHTGTIDLLEGSLSVLNNGITGGHFVMDMQSIANSDLQGEMKTKLESHLKGVAKGKGKDFFQVKKYPYASFTITQVEKLADETKTSHLVSGKLTIKDITKEIEFLANIEMDKGIVIIDCPKFTINRTDWGINYKSKSIFSKLKDNFIHDEIGLIIRIRAYPEV